MGKHVFFNKELKKVNDSHYLFPAISSHYDYKRQHLHNAVMTLYKLTSMNELYKADYIYQVPAQSTRSSSYGSVWVPPKYNFPGNDTYKCDRHITRLKFSIILLQSLIYFIFLYAVFWTTKQHAQTSLYMYTIACMHFTFMSLPSISTVYI